MTEELDWLRRKDFDEGLRWFKELYIRTIELDEEGRVEEVHGVCKKVIPGGVALLKHARSADEEFRLCLDLSCLYRKIELFSDAEEHASRAIGMDKSSFRASVCLYVALARSGKTKEALDEIWRYARYEGFVEYRDTIEELIANLRSGYLPGYRLYITALAEKVGLRV